MPMRFRANRIPLVSLAVLAAAMPAAALAADQSSEFQMLESVTVTAQKRVQNTIEVPMAITAYSGEFLSKVDIQELDKLSLYTPGFVVQNQSPNNPGLAMRGLNLDSGEAAQEPRVSVFEDDVSIATTRATYVELFDIDRVEVVRGPQTTLFGRSALMGGVNIIQNKAKLDGFSASGSFEKGDYGYYMVEGAVNQPLSDTVAVRLAGRYKSREGYVDDLNNSNRAYNSVNTAAGRLALAWKPNADFSFDFIANLEQDRPTGTAFKSGTFLPTDANGRVIGDLDHTTGATLTDSVAGFEGGKKVGLNRIVWDVKGLSTYKLSSDVTLNSVTAYRRFDSKEVFDPDGFAQPLMQAAEDERGDQFSHEVRLNYESGGRLSAFGGISYFYSNVSQRVPLQMDERMVLALVAGQNTYLQNQPASFFSSAYFNAPMTNGDPSKAGLGTQIIYAQAYTPVYNYAYSVAYPQYYAAMLGMGLPATTAAAQATTLAKGAATTNATGYVNSTVASLKSNHWEQSTNYGKTKSVDFYGDVTYKLLDQLEANGGIRYTHDDKQTAYASVSGDTSALGMLLKGASSGTGWGLLTQPTANNGDKIGQNFSDDGLSWRVSLRYAVADNASLYATYARGRRPKVLSAKSPSTPYGAPSFTEAAAETVDNYEVGGKAMLFDAVRLDTTFYFFNYKNFQSTKLVNQQYVSFNAGQAQSIGFEGTADWAITDWADFFGTLTLNRARFVGSSIYKGDQFRLNPDQKLSVGLSLRHNVFGGTLNFLPTYTWQSKVYFDDNNDRPDLQTTKSGNLIADTKQDELQRQYGLLNFRLTYQQDNKPWSVAFFVTNVLDQKFIKDAGNSGDNLGIPTFIAGEPRFLGASFTMKTH